jgi:small-conductance mechanosensitive channel
MQDLLTQLTEQVRQYVPNLLAAIAILVVGWFAALVIGAMVRGAINRLTKRKKLPETAEGAPPLPVGAWTGRVVFWILMVFVLAAAFQALQLPALVGPLDSMLQQVTPLRRRQSARENRRRETRRREHRPQDRKALEPNPG